MIVDKLLIALGLESSEAQAELKKLKNGFEELVKIGSSISIAFGFKGLLKDFLDTNKSVKMLSETLGEDYEQIQVWSEAVKTAGGSVNGLTSSIQSLNAGIQQTAISGTSSLLPVLNRLGISIRNAKGDLKLGTEILLDLTNVFDKLTNRQATKFGKQLGLDTGTIMLLKKGSKEVEEILERQRLLGIYTKEDGLITQDFNNSLDDLMQTVKSITAVFSRLALPVLIKFNDGMLKIALFVRKYENFIKGFFIGLGIAISGFLLPKLTALTLGFLKLNKSTLIITGIGVAIGLLIDDFLAWKQGGDSLFGSMYDWLNKNRTALDLMIDSLKVLAGLKISTTLLKVLGIAGSTVGGIAATGIAGAGALGIGAGFLGYKALTGIGESLIERHFQKKENAMRLRYGAMQQSNNNTNNNSISIGNIEVNTKATDSQGIVNSLVPTLENSTRLMNLNNGY